MTVSKTWEEAVADGSFRESLARSAPLSPMPSDAAEEVAAWKDGRRGDYKVTYREDGSVRHGDAWIINGVVKVVHHLGRRDRLDVVFWDASESDYTTVVRLFDVGTPVIAEAAPLQWTEAHQPHVCVGAGRSEPVLSRASADDELRTEIAVDVGSLYDQHDLVTEACLHALEKYRLELAERTREIAVDVDAVLHDLHDIATGKIEHVYMGSCPDASGRSHTVDDRADGCPACDVLRRADALLEGDEPAAPPSWTQRALARLMADPAAIARFNAARMSPEAANLIAACRKREGMQEAFAAVLHAGKDDAARVAPSITRMPAKLAEFCEAWKNGVRLDLGEGDAPAWTPPPGTDVDVLHGSLDGPCLIALVTIEPGKEWPREVHAEHEEHIVMLNGEIVRHIEFPGGSALATSYREGDDTAVPQGHPHTIRNASFTEPSTYISILRRVAPAEEG